MERYLEREGKKKACKLNILYKKTTTCRSVNAWAACHGLGAPAWCIQRLLHFCVLAVGLVASIRSLLLSLGGQSFLVIDEGFIHCPADANTFPSHFDLPLHRTPLFLDSIGLFHSGIDGLLGCALASMMSPPSTEGALLHCDVYQKTTKTLVAHRVWVERVYGFFNANIPNRFVNQKVELYFVSLLCKHPKINC